MYANNIRNLNIVRAYRDSKLARENRLTGMVPLANLMFGEARLLLKREINNFNADDRSITKCKIEGYELTWDRTEYIRH
jgi:hypothetical protein